jgi:hypothetical protein
VRQQPVFQAEDAVRERVDALVVGHDDQRGAALPHQVGQQPHHGLAVLGVQRGRRLVGEQEHRPRGQGPGHGHALALPGAQLRRPQLGPVRQAHMLQGRGRLGRCLPPRQAAHGQRQAHVVHRGQRGEEVERLEDEADVRPPEGRQRRGR